MLGTMFASTIFTTLYTLLFACNLGFLVLALPKWYREVGRLGGVTTERGGPVAAPTDGAV